MSVRTREDRQRLWGDPRDLRALADNSHAAELIRRLDAGEYLTRADAKQARKLKRTM